VRSSVRSKARTPSRIADEICEAVKLLTAKRTSHLYGAQWIMVATVQHHLGLDDEQIEAALRQATERGLVGQRQHPRRLAIQAMTVHGTNAKYRPGSETSAVGGRPDVTNKKVKTARLIRSGHGGIALLDHLIGAADDGR
jgi:hypothetical protein